MVLTQTTFADLGISADILAAIEKKGFTTPTPIQEKTIPLMLADTKDIIGQAQTGTGKTAAFGIPILEKIEEGKKKVQALILTPTRELAVQVTEEIISFKGARKVFVLPVYGGQGMDYQIKRLREGVDIVVGTPGRVIDHIEHGRLDLSEVKFFVLDEADEMLNMGFLEDVEKILEGVPADRNMLLFSATMPDRIRHIARTHMKDHHLVKIEKKPENAAQIEQLYYEVYPEDKLNALCRIIDGAKEFYALVFCRTKSGTDHLSTELLDRGYDVEALHGDVSQNQREIVMRKFKSRKSTILVATDVAARGIDVNDLTHVINYDIPGDAETYTHRIGRTGRAGKKGTAVTLITPSEFRKFSYLLKDARMNAEKGKLPNVTEVIEKKKNDILEEVSLLVSEEIWQNYDEIARNLMDFNEPEWVIATLLRKLYKEKLNPDNYPDLRDPKSKEGRKPGDSPRTERFGDRYGSRDRERGGDRGGFRDRERSGSYDRERRYGSDDRSTRNRDSFSRDRDRPRDNDRPVRRESGSGTGKYEVLFMAKGTKDGVNGRIISEFIKDETGIPSHKIYEIDVFPRHTIFKVSSETANEILTKFKPKDGKAPLIRRDRK